MLEYHSLAVAQICPEASDAVCISFEIPRALRETYRFHPGQHLGLRAVIDGMEQRRTYSICSGLDEPRLRIGVREHAHGSMSRYLARRLRVGDRIDVLAPAGRFFVCVDPVAARHYAAFAAGSGITPILGIVKNVLAQEPRSHITLFYGNRRADTIMFADELLGLKDRYPQRLALSFLLSRESQDVGLLNGRLDAAKVAELAAARLFDPRRVDGFFLCGPGAMIDVVREALVGLGVDAVRIHSERFVGDAPGAPARMQAQSASIPSVAPPDAGLSVASADELRAATGTQVTVVMDGRRRSFPAERNGETVLEAAERAGLELPYSCRAGVCSTCRTRVVRGAVSMMANYALEPWELDAGYVLCCQALPETDELELNYDER